MCNPSTVGNVLKKNDEEDGKTTQTWLWSSRSEVTGAA